MHQSNSTGVTALATAKMERQGPWSATEMSADLRVQITRDMPRLPDDLEAAVEQAWQQARAANPRLFNGLTVSADQVAPGLITGHCTEYRRVVAQLNHPTLAGRLALRPLAVCGVITCRQGDRRAVLFGQRSFHTSYHQGLWQPPPAGSVDPRDLGPDGRVDIHAALLRELQEEVGLTADDVRVMQPICMIEHPGSHVLDLAFAIHTELQADQLLAALAGLGDAEYVDARVVALEDAAQALRDWGTQVTPTAGIFLREMQKASKRVLF